MKAALFNQIKGYLDGLSNIISFYGLCYSHSYYFYEYENSLDINEVVEKFLKDSFIKRHKIEIVELQKLKDWEGELFNSCSDWFFRLFRMSNFGITYEDDNGNRIPAENHRDGNFVFNNFLKLLLDFFEGTNLQVYRLKTEPDQIDEFSWEQFIFYNGKKVYVLHFYQQG